MAQVIDGKAVAAVVRAEVQARVERLRARGVVPGLATILVGADPASQVYVRNKQRMCEAVGMNSIGQRLPADVSQAELIELVRALGRRADVHGILVQLPLPRPLDSQAVIDAIDPSKDVDGLHPVNQGRLMAGLPGLRPCTPLGVMRLLREAGVSLSGARAVVVGRSVLVGKPVAQLLLEANATVTMCHSRTRDLAGEVGRAEVVVAAVGIPCMVKGAWIREGAAVVDVGINRRDDGTLCGDVEYDVAATRAVAITPVPGGVGPMTVAMLLANTVSAAESTLGASPA